MGPFGGSRDGLNPIFGSSPVLLALHPQMIC